MKIVSLVPSLTETLIECGADVAGRTRFCIHPEIAKNISAVGGTKSVDLEKLISLKPDLVVLDREENTKEMFDAITHAGLKTVVTHIRSLDDVARDLRAIARLIKGSAAEAPLLLVAERWSKVATQANHQQAWPTFPGVMEWLTKPPVNADANVVYAIWRDPWMSVKGGTFIASVLAKLGVDECRLLPSEAQSLYPQFDFSSLQPDTIVLLSSEPFPFAKFKEEFRNLSNPIALVDGESFSWFGLRSLRFLENSLG